MELSGSINRSITLSGSMIARGLDGRGIVSIAKTGTSGLVDTYTITYTDATTSTFTVTNGANGQITATSFAEEFSSSKAYAAGDYVVYSGQLYQFTTAHAAGAWNASHATAVQIADQVSELKSALDNAECLNGAIELPKLGFIEYDNTEDVFYDKQLFAGKADVGNGLVDNPNLNCSDYIQVEPSTTYYISGVFTNSQGVLYNGAVYPQRITFFNEDKSGISSIYQIPFLPDAPRFRYCETPANCKFIRIMFASSSYSSFDNILVQKEISPVPNIPKLKEDVLRIEELDALKAELPKNEYGLPPTVYDYVRTKACEVLEKEVNGNKSFSFAFISDYHFERQPQNRYSPKMIEEFDKYRHLSMILNGGDFVDWYDTYDNSTDEANATADEKIAERSRAVLGMTNALGDFTGFGNRFLTTVGNHDWSYCIYRTAPWDYGTLYRFLFAMNEDLVINPNAQWNGQPYKYGSMGLYGYVDDKSAKVRYITLNCADNSANGYEHWGIMYLAQMEWLCDTLDDLGAKNDSSEWCVVVLGHHLYQSTTPARTTNSSIVYDILSAAKSGTSVSGTLSTGETISHTFTNHVDVVGVFTGHIHHDEMAVYNGIQCIATTSDCCGIHGGTVGDVTQSAFDVVTVNKAARTCLLTRLGSGNDRSFTF